MAYYASVILILNYLPNKKFILILIIAFILGGVFLIFSKKIFKTGKEYKKETSLILNKNENLTKDTDNDGLYDWEELLWKTKQTNPDTDHDGVSDGEEINQNRNPLVPGPNDFLLIGTEENATSTEPDTLTFKIGKEFLLKYLSTKNMESLTESQKKEIVNSMLANLVSKKTPVKYTASDIKISDDNSKENVKKYVNDLGKAFKTFAAIEKNEVAIFLEILEDENNENREKINELKKNKMFYEKAIYEISHLSPPRKYAKIHLDILNNFNNATYAISKMELIYDDPATSLIGMNEYSEESKNSVAIFKNFKKQFASDQINLNQNEDGYIFIKNYFSKI